MTPAAFAIPGDIDLPTGGYMYDRRVLALLPQFGVAVRHLELPGSFPEPTEADLAETERILAGVAGLERRAFRIRGAIRKPRIRDACRNLQHLDALAFAPALHALRIVVFE